MRAACNRILCTQHGLSEAAAAFSIRSRRTNSSCKSACRTCRLLCDCEQPGDGEPLARLTLLQGRLRSAKPVGFWSNLGRAQVIQLEHSLRLQRAGTMAALHASTRSARAPDAAAHHKGSRLRWGQLPHAPARHLASSPGLQQQPAGCRQRASGSCRAESENGSGLPTMPHPFSLPVGDTYQSDDVDLSGGRLHRVHFSKLIVA